MSLPRSNLPQAFRLVRQLLSERPRHLHEILRDGVALHNASVQSTVDGEGSAGPSEPVRPSSSKSSYKSKSKKSTSTKASSQLEIPEDHPFVSTSYLKKRILPILASQDLILIKAVRKSSAEQSSTGLSASRTRSGTHKTSFLWSIAPPYTPPSSPISTSKPESSVQWDVSAHWDALLSGTHPSKTAHAYNAIRQLRDQERKEQKFVDGVERRTERDIMRWDDRVEGLTTRLERLHLNVRRARARPGKERRNLDMMAKKTENMFQALDAAS